MFTVRQETGSSKLLPSFAFASQNELRPGALVVFYRSNDEACMNAYNAMNFKYEAEHTLPARERLMIGKYNMDFHDKRLLTEFSPEQDLPKRIGLGDTCPALVYVSRQCNGHTEWCIKDEGGPGLGVGCENFRDQCNGYRVWNGEGNWVKWAKEQIESEPWPALDLAFGSWKDQGEWIRRRERVTLNTHIRNNFLGPALPKYSETGTNMIPIPEKLKDELTKFYYKNVPNRNNEPWDIHGATQMNFHEVGTDLVYLDIDPVMRDELANKYIKPLLEEWSGIKLKLSSFYGLREYFPGSWLRNHIDRVDTHVISATLSLLKPNSTKPWPIETVDWNGKRHRYEHKAGEMLMYESATRPHGRPYLLPDGMHVGCFVHFAPVENTEYRKVLQQARQYERNNYTSVKYLSTPSVEPEHYERIERIVTPENMGRKTNDRRARAHKTEPPVAQRGRRTLQNGQMGVDFVNDLEDDMVLYWVDHDRKAQKNAYVDRGNSVRIQTYVDHQFFFAPAQIDDPKPEDFPLATMSPSMANIRASEVVGGKFNKRPLHTDL